MSNGPNSRAEWWTLWWGSKWNIIVKESSDLLIDAQIIDEYGNTYNEGRKEVREWIT